MSVKMLTPALKAAYDKLNIPTYEVEGGVAGNRIILCLDGGGIKGIMTIQMLKKMEEIAEMPLHQLVDFIAGTSTGAIIAGLLVKGDTAMDVEKLYLKFVTKVFQTKRNLFANKYLAPCEYDKVNYRQAIQDEVGDISLEYACRMTHTDILITAKNVTDNEETYFTCVHHDNDECVGTYKDTLLRAAMEATMSAPTYFSPLERFVDGGTSIYNNPTTVSVMEALEYTGKGKYEMDKLTVFSMGTGKNVESISPQRAANPGVDGVVFWLKYIMNATSDDSSGMQANIFRSQMLAGIDFRRFQISLDPEAISKLPDTDNSIADLHIVDANRLSDLTESELNGIELDEVHKFDLMRAIGVAMVDYIMLDNKFRGDLVDKDTKRDLLVTAFGYKVDPVTKMNSAMQIKANTSNVAWFNSQPTK